MPLLTLKVTDNLPRKYRRQPHKSTLKVDNIAAARKRMMLHVWQHGVHVVSTIPDDHFLVEINGIGIDFDELVAKLQAAALDADQVT